MEFSVDVFELDGIQIDKLTVRDVMSPPGVTARKGERVSEVIATMKKHHLREVPVLDGDHPVGFVGYSSLLLRRSLPLSARVEQVMLPVPSLVEDMPLPSAVEELMSAGVRGAPVVRNGKMIGFLSRGDILKVLPNVTQLRSKKVSEFMTKNPQSIHEDEGVRKAEVMMKSLMEKTLPVVDKGEMLIGAISMSDVISAMWGSMGQQPMDHVRGDRYAPDIRVASLMNRDPVAVTPDDTLERAVSLMMEKDLGMVFVHEGGRLVGVVSQADLMEQIISLKPREGVYVQITGLDEQDPDVYDTLYSQIEKSMNRINKLHNQTPRVFTLHVSKYHSEGLRTKYSLQSRLTSDHGMYYSNATEWDLFKTMDILLDYLEKGIKKEKGKDLDMRKKRQGL